LPVSGKFNAKIPDLVKRTRSIVTLWASIRLAFLIKKGRV
jgi:hypothetical protein